MLVSCSDELAVHSCPLFFLPRKILITQRAVQSNAKADLIVVRSIDIRCSGEFVAEAQIFA